MINLLFKLIEVNLCYWMSFDFSKYLGRMILGWIYDLECLMRDLHRTVVIFIASCSTSDGADKSWKNSTIAVRSSRDRAAIAARSNRDLTSFIAETLQSDPTAADRDPGPRSTPVRCLIVARSGLFLERNSSRFILDLKPQCRSVQTTPTIPWFRPHERVNCPWSSGQFSL